MTTVTETLGRQTIRIGSAEEAEVQVPGTAPLAATLVHLGEGQLRLLVEAEDVVTQDGRPLEFGSSHVFDFKTRFELTGSELDLGHAAICAMVLSRGYLPAAEHEVVIGRDPERCHLVLPSRGVSARHGTLSLEPLAFIDHGSTSGTFLSGERLPPEVETPVSATALLALGPLPLPIALVLALHAEMKSLRAAAFSVVKSEAFHLGPPPQLPAVPPPIAVTTPPADHALFARPHQALLPDALATTLPPDTSSPVEAPPPPSLDAPPPPPPPSFNPLEIHPKHRTVMGTIRMVASMEHTIGRTADNAIVLDYPQVSGHHAKLIKVGRDVFVEDLGSELGTYVRGSRLRPKQRAKVADGERIRFGPISTALVERADALEITVEDREGWAGRPLFEIEAADLGVVVPDRDDPGADKRLLEGVSFKALPGDLVALMGPSGSGKTTLLHCLTGYITPSQGEVRVNGQPLALAREALRGSIGYVPQDDIIHPELTVREAVRYSARFRLPPDYSDREIEARVDAALAELGLEAVAHLEIGRPEQKVLSGGQRKRVNIAIELVTDPVLLFLDEPTSGLAADDTTALIELLSRLAREGGKTIIATIHQPAKDEYQQFNVALVLGHGGVPVYFGPTRDAYGFFESWRTPTERQGIDTPRDMFAELSEREARFRLAMPGASRTDVRLAVSRAYQTEYQRSSVAAQMFSGPRSVSSALAEASPLPARERPRGQLGLLLGRYLRIKVRDRVGMAILLLQAPLIGVLLSLVFGLQKTAAPHWCLGALDQLRERAGSVAKGAPPVGALSPTPDHAPALFFLIVAAVWFGTSNAAREIVSERAIFRRERMVNLRVSNYVLSKFIVLSALSMLQCVALLAIVWEAIGLGGGPLAFGVSLSAMMLTSVCSVALGLLLSTVVMSSEAAMALTPIALIPQVVLGGLMVPVTTNPWLEAPMLTIPARWGFEAVVRVERAAVAPLSAWNIRLDGVRNSLPDFIEGGAFRCAIAQMESSELLGAWGFGSHGYAVPLALLVLAAMTAGLLTVVRVVLERRA